MPPIDYMKVLDIAALTLEAGSHIELNALDLKLFKASLTREDGSVLSIILKINEYDLELSIDKEVLDKKQFQEWLTKFEFQLEQNFFKNISLERAESKNDYKIKILF